MKKLIILLALMLALTGICYASGILEGSGIEGIRWGDIITTGNIVDHSGNNVVTSTGDQLIFRDID